MPATRAPGLHAEEAPALFSSSVRAQKAGTENIVSSSNTGVRSLLTLLLPRPFFGFMFWCFILRQTGSLCRLNRTSTSALKARPLPQHPLCRDCRPAPLDPASLPLLEGPHPSLALAQHLALPCRVSSPQTRHPTLLHVLLALCLSGLKSPLCPRGCHSTDLTPTWVLASPVQ